MLSKQLNSKHQVASRDVSKENMNLSETSIFAQTHEYHSLNT